MIQVLRMHIEYTGSDKLNASRMALRSAAVPFGFGMNSVIEFAAYMRLGSTH